MPQFKTRRVLLLCAFCACMTFSVSAQTPDAAAVARSAVDNSANASGNSADAKSDIEEVRRILREQQAELERMREIMLQQSQIINELRQRVEQTGQFGASTVAKTSETVRSDAAERASQDAASQTPPSKNQTSDQDARLTRLEEQAKKMGESLTKQLGSISFSGDIRLRFESFYGQLNALPNGENPAVVGNELSARQRARLRARLALRGQISKEFDWGLRFATGSYADAISTNQTLTDFYNRKPFALDQAFINYRPERVPGLRLQGGKFEAPWVSTEMVFDNDLQFEGFNETYSRDFKSGALKNLTFAAWQLPFLERNSAFIRNANGTINRDESRRAGRDLALYGGQLRARLELTPTIALTLSAADYYFSGTQFITPIQFFGGQLQLPVTVTIPATATTPAQTVTTQVTISRDQLVAGNGNLGLSSATNNATNRDGRLSSGFNLVDLIGRFDLNHSKRFPVTLLFDFVTNTQTHDVVVAGPGGANRFLRNDENKGLWAELQVGKARERGDVLFGYTFMRIEKDAVLTPFNFSDIAQQSDVRVHRFVFNYAADPRVILSLTGLISERPNGLPGVFGITPPGSLNRPTTRLQFDTVFRF